MRFLHIPAQNYFCMKSVYDKLVLDTTSVIFSKIAPNIIVTELCSSVFDYRKTNLEVRCSIASAR